jgi:hypothetical protein
MPKPTGKQKSKFLPRGLLEKGRNFGKKACKRS